MLVPIMNFVNHEIINEVENTQSVTSTCRCGWNNRTHLSRGDEDFAIGMHEAEINSHFEGNFDD